MQGLISDCPLSLTSPNPPVSSPSKIQLEWTLSPGITPKPPRWFPCFYFCPSLIDFSQNHYNDRSFPSCMKGWEVPFHNLNHSVSGILLVTNAARRKTKLNILLSDRTQADAAPLSMAEPGWEDPGPELTSKIFSKSWGTIYIIKHTGLKCLVWWIWQCIYPFN